MYSVTTSSILGDAGDSLAYHNGMKFSTNDKDNDESNTQCAQKFKSAWWYKNCYQSSLNGRYSSKSTVARGHGIQWRAWKGDKYSLKKSEMKTRPSQFSNSRCLNFLTEI